MAENTPQGLQDTPSSTPEQNVPQAAPQEQSDATFQAFNPISPQPNADLLNFDFNRPVSKGEQKARDIPQITSGKKGQVQDASRAKRADAAGIAPEVAQAMEYDNRADFLVDAINIPFDQRRAAWDQAQDLRAQELAGTDRAVFDINTRAGQVGNNILAVLDDTSRLVGNIASMPAAFSSVAGMIGVSGEDMARFFEIQQKQELGLDLDEEEQDFLKGREAKEWESSLGIRLSTPARMSKFDQITAALTNQEITGAIQDASRILDPYIDRTLSNQINQDLGNVTRKAIDGEISGKEVFDGLVSAVKDNPGAVTQMTMESLVSGVFSGINMPLSIASNASGKYLDTLKEYEKIHGEPATGEDLATLVAGISVSALSDTLGDRWVVGNTVSITKGLEKLLGKKVTDKVAGNLLTRTVKSGVGEVAASGGADVAQQFAAKQDIGETDVAQALASGIAGGLSAAQQTGVLDAPGSAARTVKKGVDRVEQRVEDAITRNNYREAVKSGDINNLPKQGEEGYDANEDIKARQAMAEEQTDQEKTESVQAAQANLNEVAKEWLQKGKDAPKELTKKFVQAQESLNEFRKDVASRLDAHVNNLAEADTNTKATNDAIGDVLGSIDLLSAQQAEAVANNENLDLTDTERGMLRDQAEFAREMEAAPKEFVEGNADQPGVQALAGMIRNAINSGDKETAEALIQNATEWRDSIAQQLKDSGGKGKAALAAGLDFLTKSIGRFSEWVAQTEVGQRVAGAVGKAKDFAGEVGQKLKTAAQKREEKIQGRKDLSPEERQNLSAAMHEVKRNQEMGEAATGFKTVNDAIAAQVLAYDLPQNVADQLYREFNQEPPALDNVEDIEAEIDKIQKAQAGFSETSQDPRHQQANKKQSDQRKQRVAELKAKRDALIAAEQVEQAQEDLQAAQPKIKASVFSGNWTRDDVSQNPDKLYVFGDNDRRVGKGGQAVIRGLANAIGIRTKKAPSRGDGAYYTDAELEDNKAKIDEDINRIKEQAAETGQEVVLPIGGFGTGLAQLQQRAPQTFDYLNQRLEEEFGFVVGQEQLQQQAQQDPDTQETQTTPEAADRLDSVIRGLESAVVEAVLNRKNPTLSDVLTEQVGLSKIPVKPEGMTATAFSYTYNWVRAYFDSRGREEDAASGNMLQTVPDLFDALKTDPTIVEEHLGRELTDQEKANLAKMIEMNDKLNGIFDNVYVVEDQKVKNGPGYYRNRDLMRDLRDPATGEYAPNVRSAINTAIYNWLATRASDTLFNDEETIRTMLGLQPNDPIDDAAFQLFGGVGTGRSSIVETLGKDIMKLLDIAATKDAPVNAETNMANSLGLMALQMMQEGGYVTETTINPQELAALTGTKPDSNANRNFIRVANHQVDGNTRIDENVASIIGVNAKGNNSTKGDTNLLDGMFQVQKHRTGPTLEASQEVPKTMKGNRQKLGKTVRNAVKNQQQRKHFVKQDGMKVIDALGKDNLLKILGWKEPSSQHELRVDKQRSINNNHERSVNYLNDLAEKLSNNDGLGTPIFFEHEVWKTFRIGMKSNTVNPQGNKFHRSLIAQEGWQTDISFNNKHGIAQFWNAMDEPLGLDNEEKLQKNPDYMGAVQILQQFLRTDEMPEDGSDQLTEIMLKHKLGPDAMDAFINLARYYNAKEDLEAARTDPTVKATNSFYTDMYIEVDGKTNGPIIGLIQFFGAQNPLDLLNRTAKGGFFGHDNKFKNSDQYKKGKGIDAYQEIAKMWTKAIRDKALGADSVMAGRLNAVERIFGIIDKLGNDNHKILRDLAKNPLMVTAYGSGEKSVSEALGQQFIERIYDTIQEAVDTNDMQMYEELIFQVNQIVPNAFKSTSDPLKAVLKPDAERQIRDFIEKEYGTTINEAVRANYQEFVDNRTTINNAFDLMYRMYRATHDDMVEKKLEQGIKNGTIAKGVTHLTNAQMDEIQKELQTMSPLLHNMFSKKNDNVEQAINVGKEEMQEAKGPGSSSFRVEGKYQTGNKETHGLIRTPSAPGVGPGVLSIHSQDATMMYMQYAQGMDNLGVHDANLWGINDVLDGGQSQNTAMYEVMKEMSIPEETFRSLKRARDQFSAYYRNLETKQEKDALMEAFGNFDRPLRKGESAERYAAMESLSKSAKQGKDDFLKLVNKVDQFAHHNGGSEITVNPKESPVNSDSTSEEVFKAGEKSGKEGVQEVLKSRETLEQLGDPNQYDDSETVDVTNSMDVFDSLPQTGGKQENSIHKDRLRSIVNDLAVKLQRPFNLYQRSRDVNQNYGAASASDVFLTNMLQGREQSSGMIASGVPMSNEEVMAHELSHLVYQQGLRADSKARREITRLFQAAKKQLDYTAFLNDQIDVNDPANADAVAMAKERYNYLFNNTPDKSLQEFAAFGLTNENFQRALNEIKYDSHAFKGDTVWEMLRDIYDYLTDMFSEQLLKSRGIPRTEYLQKLLDGTLKVNHKKKPAIMDAYEGISQFAGPIMSAPGIIADAIAERIGDGQWAHNDSRPTAQALGRALRGDNKVANVSQALLNHINKLRDQHFGTQYGWIQQTIDEIIGRTVDNADIRDLARKGNEFLDRPRKAAIDNMVIAINKAFKEPIEDKEKEALTQVLLRLDVASLQGLGDETIQNIMSDPAVRQQHIADLESTLRSFPNFNFYVRQARNLGYFMATGNSRESMTLLNAHNIARLYGNSQARMNSVTEAEAARAQPAIDMLATLYGIEQSREDQRQTTADVMAREFAADNTNNGITAILRAADTFKADARDKQFADHDEADTHMIKGWTKEHYSENSDLQFSTNPRDPELLAQGYTPVERPIPQDPQSPGNEAVYMYHSPDGAQAPYMSGIVSLVSELAKGVRNRKVAAQRGAVNPALAGKNRTDTMNQSKAGSIEQMHDTPLSPTDKNNYMIPIVNPQGEIVDWRYMANHETRNGLMQRDNDVANVLGDMAGDAVGKARSKTLNREVIDTLKDIFDKDYDNRKDAYVTIGPDSTGREAEIWRMMPQDMKDYAEQVFPDGIKIRKDLVIPTFGQRAYSIREAFSNPEFNNAFENLITELARTIWGDNAANMMAKIEKAIKTGVRDIKTMVIVKSGFITLANTLSNTFFLMQNGMDPVNAVKAQIEGLKGAHEYRRDMKRMAQIDLQQEQQQLSSTTLQRLRRERAHLAKRVRENPVTPAMQAGLMPGIVEDPSLQGRRGKKGFHDQAVDKVIEKTRLGAKGADILKNILMTEDSEKFNFMNTLATDSDFIARYAFLKHQQQQAGDQAAQQFEHHVAEAEELFVNYAAPTARGVQYANDMGLAWYTRYMMRAHRSVAKAVVNNPSRALGIAMGLDWLTDNSLISTPLESTAFGGRDLTKSFIDPTNPLGKFTNWKYMDWNLYAPANFF